MRNEPRLRTARATVLACLLAFADAGCVDDLEVLSVSNSNRVGLPDGPSPDILYRLDEGSGLRLLDSSMSGNLVHLTISTANTIAWSPDGLRLLAPSRISSTSPPLAFVSAARRSRQLTVEAWVTPTEFDNKGFHRIVTLSQSLVLRNFSLEIGDEYSRGVAGQFAHRLRTSQGGDLNGFPVLVTGGPEPIMFAPTHVVAVHAADGAHLLYVDGKLVVSGKREGTFDNWNTTYLLGVGNEFNNDDDDQRRGFVGDIHQIAIYSAALSEAQVKAHFAAGSKW